MGEITKIVSTKEIEKLMYGDQVMLIFEGSQYSTLPNQRKPSTEYLATYRGVRDISPQVTGLEDRTFKILLEDKKTIDSGPIRPGAYHFDILHNSGFVERVLATSVAPSARGAMYVCSEVPNIKRDLK